MPRTRDQSKKNNQSSSISENMTTTVVRAPPTSVVSVQTDREVGPWSDPPHDLTIRAGTSTQSLPVSSGFTHRSRDVLKLARDIIPQFDGTNMSVNMFIEHCRVAATTVDDDDMHLLIMFIKNRVTGQARKHIQDARSAKLRR